MIPFSTVRFVSLILGFTAISMDRYKAHARGTDERHTKYATQEQLLMQGNNDTISDGTDAQSNATFDGADDAKGLVMNDTNELNTTDASNGFDGENATDGPEPSSVTENGYTDVNGSNATLVEMIIEYDGSEVEGRVGNKIIPEKTNEPEHVNTDANELAKSMEIVTGVGAARKRVDNSKTEFITDDRKSFIDGVLTTNRNGTINPETTVAQVDTSQEKLDDFPRLEDIDMKDEDKLRKNIRGIGKAIDIIGADVFRTVGKAIYALISTGGTLDNRRRKDEDHHMKKGGDISGSKGDSAADSKSDDDRSEEERRPTDREEDKSNHDPDSAEDTKKSGSDSNEAIKSKDSGSDDDSKPSDSVDDSKSSDSDSKSSDSDSKSGDSDSKSSDSDKDSKSSDSDDDSSKSYDKDSKSSDSDEGSKSSNSGSKEDSKLNENDSDEKSDDHDKKSDERSAEKSDDNAKEHNSSEEED